MLNLHAKKRLKRLTYQAFFDFAQNAHFFEKVRIFISFIFAISLNLFAQFLQKPTLKNCQSFNFLNNIFPVCPIPESISKKHLSRGAFAYAYSLIQSRSGEVQNASHADEGIAVSDCGGNGYHFIGKFGLYSDMLGQVLAAAG